MDALEVVPRVTHGVREGQADAQGGTQHMIVVWMGEVPRLDFGRIERIGRAQRHTPERLGFEKGAVQPVKALRPVGSRAARITKTCLRGIVKIEIQR